MDDFHPLQCTNSIRRFPVKRSTNDLIWFFKGSSGEARHSLPSWLKKSFLIERCRMLVLANLCTRECPEIIGARWDFLCNTFQFLNGCKNAGNQMHFLRNLRNNLVSRARRDFLCNRFLPISDGITQMSNCSFREIEVSYAIGVNLSACQHEEGQ